MNSPRGPLNRTGLLTIATLLAFPVSIAGQLNLLLIDSVADEPELSTYDNPCARTPTLDKLAA